MTMERRISPLAIALAASTLLVGCATDRQVIRQAEDTNSELEPAIMSDPELTGYLQQIGDRIVAAAKEADQAHQGPKTHFEDEDNSWMFKEKEFHLVDSKTLNAFTTGGEHVYIYSELLEKCRSEDELAAVMAHEYAHVYSRHVHKGMNRQYTAMGLAAGAGLVGYAAGGKNRDEYAAAAFISTSTAAAFLDLGYTRDDEAEADKWGFYFYSHAGWDPQHFGDFFQQLIDAGLDKTPEAMSDHPSLASRVQAANQRAGALPSEAKSWRRAPIADAQHYAAIKQRTVLVAKTMKTSEEVAAAQTLLSAVPSCLLPVDQPEQKAAQEKLAATVRGTPPKSAPPKRNGAR